MTFYLVLRPGQTKLIVCFTDPAGEYLRITTVVPCEHCMEAVLVS